MLGKLAFRNVRRQLGNYLIYFVTVAMTIALMFAVNNMTYSKQLKKLAEDSNDINSMLTFVTVFVSLITAFVLSYATIFMLKLRKKEFGMYLTLGMTRSNIQMLFLCETWLLSGLAMVIGLGCGLLLYQFLMALLSSFLEITFVVSTYSIKGIVLTVLISVCVFIVASLVSIRYLKRVTIYELLQEEKEERGEKHLGLWSVILVLFAVGTAGSLWMTYCALMDAYNAQNSLSLLAWLGVDLVMFFLLHLALSRTLAGILLKNKRIVSNSTNTVILRGISGRMTVNSILIGVLATLLIFSIVVSNISFAEKVLSDRSVEKSCPYDVLVYFSADEEPGFSREEGEKKIETYCSIASEYEYQLWTTNKADLCSLVLGYDEMGWTDKYMTLTQFNRLLTGCGYDPITLQNEYLVITTLQGISEETNFSKKMLNRNGVNYTWAESRMDYPEFVDDWLYFVVPDEAVSEMEIAANCVAYTLNEGKYDATAMVEDLHYNRETDYGMEEMNDYRVKEYYRQYMNANSGVLVISMLYLSTIFVCMALAILSLKTLSTMSDEQRRFAILYRLGADETMQRRTLFRQTFAFFFLPFFIPFVMSIPTGFVCAKNYQVWGYTDLIGQAMLTAIVIALVMLGVYILYFYITYRIACNHVICDGTDRLE